MHGKSGRTVRDLRRENRTAVLRRLYFDGPMSRLVLGPATGLSSVEAAPRRADHGPNRRPRTRRPSAVRRLLGELTHFFAVASYNLQHPSGFLPDGVPASR